MRPKENNLPRSAIPRAAGGSIHVVFQGFQEPQSDRVARAALEGPLELDQSLGRLARDRKLGPAILLGATPLEPMLQWREQLILNSDVAKHLANDGTVRAFAQLAADLEDDRYWTALGEELG